MIQKFQEDGLRAMYVGYQDGVEESRRTVTDTIVYEDSILSLVQERAKGTGRGFELHVLHTRESTVDGMCKDHERDCDDEVRIQCGGED